MNETKSRSAAADLQGVASPRDYALYVMEMGVELARMADNAGLPGPIGHAYRRAARAAQDAARDLDPQRSIIGSPID